MKINNRLAEVLKSTPQELKQQYIDIINGREPDAPEQLPDFFTVAEAVEQVRNLPEEKVISTGWSGLDALAAGGIAEGEVVLMVAPAGAGKTHFAVNLALNYAKQGENVFYLTMEDGWKMILKRFRVLDPQDTAQNNIFMVHEDELTLKNAVEVIKKATLDAKLIIVDNLFALPLKQGNKGDYWQSQAEWVDDICNMIRSTTSSALILHHLNKSPNSSEAARYQIAGSTRLVNRVAQVWLMLRSETRTGTIAVRVDKHRRTAERGECFLKSDSLGILSDVRANEVNPEMLKQVKSVFNLS